MASCPDGREGTAVTPAAGVIVRGGTGDRSPLSFDEGKRAGRPGNCWVIRALCDEAPTGDGGGGGSACDGIWIADGVGALPVAIDTVGIDPLWRRTTFASES